MMAPVKGGFFSSARVLGAIVSVLGFGGLFFWVGGGGGGGRSCGVPEG